MTLTPAWISCLHDDGCKGARWGEGDVCLAHLDEPALHDALAELHPGSDIDLRGTRLTQGLLDRVLSALTPDGDDAVPRIGIAKFDGAQFSELGWFRRAQFSGDAWFEGAQFSDGALFSGVQFDGNARFREARFTRSAEFDGARFSKKAVFARAQVRGSALFEKAQFSGEANFISAQVSENAGFIGAQFSGEANFGAAKIGETAWFSGAQFSSDADFSETQFSKDAWFNEAQFSDDADFGGAQFSKRALFDGARFAESWIGPLVCQRALTARQITTARTVRLQVAARQVVLVGARFAEPSVFSVRYAEVDLTDMAGNAPVTVAWHAVPFTLYNGTPATEEGLSGSPQASVVSLAGTDAANIVLSDVDVSSCVFSGAHHLDQIRLEGRCQFAAAPRGWRWGRAAVPARRWTRRKVLAEEAAWRAAPERRSALARAGWSSPGRAGEPPVPAAEPSQLAVLYRQLRKALEDGKDTPGAADFYYGEMEARRHDTRATPRRERALLHAYWLLSGYALRASRALGFLAAAAGATFLLMMALGLPDNQLNPQITGTVPASGGHVVLVDSTPEPALTLPLGQRFTAARADQSGLVVVNSVVFRSTGAALTGPGTWIEIISRIGEPILLGFAAIAARGRVQR